MSVEQDHNPAVEVVSSDSGEDAASGDNADEIYEAVFVDDAAPAALVVVAAANRR